MKAKDTEPVVPCIIQSNFLVPLSTQCTCPSPENVVHAMCVPAAMDDPHAKSL